MFGVHAQLYILLKTEWTLVESGSVLTRSSIRLMARLLKIS